MSTIGIERVGDSIVLSIDGWTLMLPRADALTLGSRIMQVAALGADVLKPIDSMTPTSPETDAEYRDIRRQQRTEPLGNGSVRGRAIPPRDSNRAALDECVVSHGCRASVHLRGCPRKWH